MLNRLVNSVWVASFLLVLSSNVMSQSWAPQVTDAVTHLSAVDFLDDQRGFAAGAFGVVLKTTNSGADWTEVYSGTGLSYSDMCFINPNTGWVVGESGVIVKTADGGATWTRQTSGTTAWLNCVYFYDANNGWAAGANGVMVKTVNGGTTWTGVSTGTTATIEGGCFTSASAGWMATNSGAVIKTIDAGNSWSAQAIAVPHHLNAVHFVTPLVGWVAGNGGKLLKTNDGGATWIEQTSGTTRNLNAIAFANVDTCWVVGDNGVIHVTNNGGASWSSQISATTQNLRDVFFTNARHGWAVGLNSTIVEYAIVHALPIQLARFTAAAINNSVRLEWTTISEVNNFGFFVERQVQNATEWIEVPNSFIAGNGTTNQPQHYSFVDRNVGAGTWLYRLRQHDLDGTVNYTEPVSVDILTSVEGKDLPTEFALKQNYPNPFNPSTTIEFSIAKAGLVSLRVFDVLGKEVATIVNEPLNQGSYTKTFSAEGLSSGMYLYKLTAGDFVTTKKFVLSK
jgi:photosystem II stability/assembly factor-like uncharacterized protein